MEVLIATMPIAPLAGFLFLGLFGGNVSRRTVAMVGCGSVGVSAMAALWMAFVFLTAPPEGSVVRVTLWRWMEVAGFEPGLGLHVDALSLLMVLVITGVGFLIHLYSTEYMAHDDGYGRFFAYLNLFVGFMLILVLADNLAMLLLGWEGVGLCSYLLIGFWYRVPAHGQAARKAFIVTRLGDTAFIVGLLLLFHQLGTLDIQEMLRRAPQEWETGAGLPVAVAALLLGGALGKSAQVPLQTWLPDAMAGPTPVSALIHAATMVTAGVYLIARMHGLFELAPQVMGWVSVIGAVTLLVAGCSALVQRDIKRVLAYSTMSQIGYMFLALGVGAWTAAMFHFMTHAFFKALLFLAAGALIHAIRNEQDLFKMGGLRTTLPLVFWTFLVGAASLVALPWITAGFYSKELILDAVWHSSRGGAWLWAAGVLGALITALYTTRMVWLAFLGGRGTQVDHQPGGRIQWVLIALALLAVVGGLVEPHGGLEHQGPFARFLAPVLAASEAVALEAGGGWLIPWIPVIASLSGIAGAWLLYARFPHWTEAMVKSRVGHAIHQFWLEGWGFDRVYDALIRRPCVWLAEVDPWDIVDSFYTALGRGVAWAHRVACRTQTGSLRRYAAGIAAGLAVILALGFIFYRVGGLPPAQPGDARPSDGIEAASEGNVTVPSTDSSA